MSLFEMFMDLDLCINREVVIWGIDDDKEDWEELYNKCVWSSATQNGVNGCKVTSKINGNSIFLPATGRYVADGSNNIYDIGSSGYYWSSSLDRTYINSNAWGVEFSYRQIDFVSWGRAAGFSIRPVCP